ncbi:predicted protein [Streptomyces viridochromogenes DSM 40736]|uniref:Predicted protein n=1 Tax=Streptomyces viridochromogenes (strain DSM 40736 / JCM 4977 / BCRC 1201 / Tue 494) TaxID=591159 RepID=D9X7F1_STRVT|nr:predicted protein [Streptomyces viridochromogenes DSM 40736]
MSAEAIGCREGRVHRPFGGLINAVRAKPLPRSSSWIRGPPHKPRLPDRASRTLRRLRRGQLRGPFTMGARSGRVLWCRAPQGAGAPCEARCQAARPGRAW